MKLYRVSIENDNGETVEAWVGTQADAKAKLKGWQDKLAERSPFAEVEAIEVPTDKPGLLDWLNANAVAPGRID